MDRRTDRRTDGALQYLPSRAFGAAGDKNGKYTYLEMDCSALVLSRQGCFCVLRLLSQDVDYTEYYGFRLE